MVKATIAGDFLSSQLSEISFNAGGEWSGLWARPAIPSTVDVSSLSDSLASVAINVALASLAAVPVWGQALVFAVKIGQFLSGLFSTPDPPPVLVPLSKYSKDTDEDLVNQVLRPLCEGFDWTSIFEPPFEVDVGWTSRLGDDELTQVWGPFKGNELAWSSGIGAVPGTTRMAGQVQTFWAGPAHTGIHRTDGSGAVCKAVLTTDCGTFFPAASTFAGNLWQWANKPGSPDMYKIDCNTLLTAWSDFWGVFFDSLNHLFAKASATERRTIGNVMGTWFASRSPKTPLVGVPDLGMVLPADLWLCGPGFSLSSERFECLYLLNPNASGASEQNKFGGSLVEAKRFGLTCIPFPPATSLLLHWESVHTAVVKTSLDRLRAAQEASLWNTHVCAYTRPDQVVDLPAYAAFARDPSLAQSCREARKKLLVHPSRHRVNLDDAESIDPVFAQSLRDSGVTGKPTFELSGPLADVETPPPIPPADDTKQFFVPPHHPNGGGGAGLLLGALALGGLAAAAFWRRRA